MINRNRKRIRVVHHEFDMDKILGVHLTEAAKYLTELAKTLPADATIEDETNSYDPVYLEVQSYREETDEEYSYRIELEEQEERRKADEAKKQKEKEARRKQWEELNKEFGLYRR